MAWELLEGYCSRGPRAPKAQWLDKEKAGARGRDLKHDRPVHVPGTQSANRVLVRGGPREMDWWFLMSAGPSIVCP